MLSSALVALLAISSVDAAPSSPAQPAGRLLLVTVTKGYRHDSIVDLARLVTGIGAEGAFTLDRARTDEELRAKTTPEALAGYSGIVFASTTGDLPVADREALLRWVEGGGAVIGIHAAADTFHGYPAFLDMLGGEFQHHGPQAKVRVLVRDKAHAATRGLPPAFDVFDEIYQYKRYDPARVHLLLGLDAHPETGAPGKFPLAWTRQAGKGRVFYTALGHRQDVIAAPWYRDHVRGGIAWALGRLP
jgi:type 1 glutamine amidotransferase